MDGKTLISIEPHTKAALNKIIKFLEKKPTSKTVRIGGLNAAAQALLRDVDSIRIEEIDGGIYGHVGSGEDYRKIARQADKRYNSTYENTHVYVRKDDSFKDNTRYEIVLHSDGLIQFEELEPIAPENINMRYEQPLLSVYLTEA
jgi:hypothetical protein